MRALSLVIPVLLVLGVGAWWLSQRGSPEPISAPVPEPAAGLEPVETLLAIEDQEARAHALFAEVGKVLTHPRCANCHVADDRPLQGDAGALHQPLVDRSNGGAGAAGMLCVTCHGAEPFENVPGTPGWILAPEELAWAGRSVAEICTSLKEARGDYMDDLTEYLRTNPMVDHGWTHPEHLESAPGDRANVAALFEAWVESGAHCPDA